MLVRAIVMTVLASVLIALTKPVWLRSHRGWSNILAFAAWAALLWIMISDASAVQLIEDRLEATPDSSLRTVQSVITDALQTQHTYFPLLLILILAALCVWGLGRIRTPKQRTGNAA